MVGGIAFLLLVACLVFFFYKRRKRGDDSGGLPRPVPYIAAPTSEAVVEPFVGSTPGMSDTTPSWPIEKGETAGAGVATILATQQRLGWNSTASGSGGGHTSSEATDLRNQVDNLRREMAEMRTQREYDMLPPSYGQI